MQSPGYAKRLIALDRLQHVGDWPRLIENATALLALDPDDKLAHTYLATAHLELEDLPAARHHIDALFAIDPEDPHHHCLIATYHLHRNNTPQAESHLRYAIQIEPESAINHAYLAHLLTALEKHADALHHIDIARTLAPDDPDIIAAAVAAQHAADPSATTPQARLDELARALRIHPEHPGIIHAAGTIYLDGLADPATAEDHFRRALILRPTDRDFRRSFFRAVLQRSLLYRLLDFPTAVYARRQKLADLLTRQPAHALLLIPLAPFAVIFVLWLIISVALYTLPALAYEWLLVSEVKLHAISTQNAPLPPLSRFLHRRPFALKFTLVLTAIAAFYLAVFHLAEQSVFALSPVAAALFTAALTFAHIALVLILPRLRTQPNKTKKTGTPATGGARS